MTRERDDATVLRLLENLRQQLDRAEPTEGDDELLERFKPLPFRSSSTEADNVRVQIEELRRTTPRLPALADSSRFPGGKHFGHPRNLGQLCVARFTQPSPTQFAAP